MKTSSAKSKGRLLQQKVAALILKAFPSLNEDDVKSTSMGVSGEDVQLSQAARELFPYSVECKNLKRIAIYKHYEQAESANRKCEPLLVIKQNRSKALAVVDLEVFIDLLGRLK